MPSPGRLRGRGSFFRISYLVFVLMLTAFVAGATGYTGREVVRALVARGVRAVAHVRPDSPRLAEWRERFGEVGADVDATPWEEPAIRAALARWRPTHVFALLGTTRERG